MEVYSNKISFLTWKESIISLLLCLLLCSHSAAYAFNGAHWEANKIRKEKSLPVYLELLGDHPFTATLMEGMGASYLVLEDYDNSIKYIREALRMRKQFLGDHQETARSYHDLGKVIIF